MDNYTNINQTNSGGKKAVITGIIVGLLALAIGGVGVYYWSQMDRQQVINQAKTDERNATLAEVEAQKATEATKAPTKTSTETTCNADELSLEVKEDGESTGAGTFAYGLVFTNIGERECNLFGYPGVSLVNNNGNLVGEPTARVEAAESIQNLKPQDKVSAEIRIPDSANLPEGQCKTGATKLKVYPPNDTGYLSVTAPVESWCPDFKVYPVVAFSS